MKTSGRRKLDAGLLAVGAGMAGVAGGIGAGIGDSERVVSMWIVAEARQDANTRVVEVIDYDFGALATDKHGIYRDIPGFGPIDPTASSETAPDDVLVQPSPIAAGQTRIRIGDPFETVSGRHRYTVNFGLADVMDGTDVAWDAIGTSWNVPISTAEVHLVAPQEIVDVRCVTGGAGSTNPCTVEDVEPGHVMVTVTDMGANEGITMYGRLDGPVGEAPDVPLPDPLDDSGNGLAKPVGLAAAGALVASGPTSRLLRRAGRDRVAGGGAADAAYATRGSEVLIDSGELADMATTEFEPPRGLTPAHGGVLWAERVTNDHKVAWLMQQAIEGSIDIRQLDKKAVTLVRTGLPSPAATGILTTMFAGRSEVPLGKYDPKFASAWGKVDAELQKWSEQSGSFDPAGDARRTKAMAFGFVLFAMGGVGAVIGGIVAARSTTGLIALAVAAAAMGVGFTMMIKAWELRVKTPAGSGAWLRLESFRRFLASSEAQHVERAASMGLLREYTAWAVALGEVDRWTKAMAQSTVVPPDILSTAIIAGSLSSMTSSAATKPSSSSSGGGGGGVGGGGGGGGGGSW